MNQPATAAQPEAAFAGRSNPLLSTFAYFACILGLGLLMAALGPTLPDLARHTRAQLREASYLFMFRSFGFLLGSFLSGRLYDRMAGHPVMAGAALIVALTAVAMPVMPLLWALAAVILLQGLGGGALNVGSNTLVVWAHRGRAGGYMTALHFCFGVGACLSPILVNRASRLAGGVNWAYWTMALVLVPLAVWLLRLDSPTMGKAVLAAAPRQVNALLVALIAFFFTLYTGAEATFSSWLFSYTVKSGLGGATAAAYLTSAFWATLTAGRLAAIPLIARFRPRTILYSALAGALLAVLLMLHWPESSAVLWLGTCLAGLSLASIFPTMLSFAARRMVLTGQVTGFFYVGSAAGSMSVPWLVGQMFESYGPRVMMWLALADLLLEVTLLTGLIVYSARPVVSRPVKQG